jgi:ketosteroid isomerase-like protein
VPATPPQEALAREVFTALEARDLANLQILLAPGAVLHVPGRNPHSGKYHGCHGFLQFWGELSHRTAGRLEVRIHDVLVGHKHAAVLATNIVEREGERLESRVVYLLRLETGRVAECWVHNYDQHRVDAFWR